MHRAKACTVLLLLLLSVVTSSRSAQSQSVSAPIDTFCSASQGFSPNPEPPTSNLGIDNSPQDRLDQRKDPFTYIVYFGKGSDAFSVCRENFKDAFDNCGAPTLQTTTAGISELRLYPREIVMPPEPKAKQKTVVTKKSLPKSKLSIIAEHKITKEDRAEKRRVLALANSKKTSAVDANYYLAKANVLTENWDLAWQMGETIFRKYPDDAMQAKRMMNLYEHAYGRYTEYCIWCTRFLRVANDWESFIVAYDKRERCERLCEIIFDYSDCHNSNCGDTPINVAGSPITIFFHLQGDGIQRANQQSIFSYCAACLEQWVIGSGFKFCFQIVDNAKAADITCEIKSPQRLYGENLSSTQAPKMHPITPPLGETICSAPKFGRTKTLLTLYTESAPDFDPKSLACIFLHEVGHALGLWIHSKAPEDVMFKDATVLDKLSSTDNWRIQDLYKSAPVSLEAVNQFISKLKD